MSELFPNQNYGRIVYKHNELPIFETDEFDFYRCLEFKDEFYGKTILELHLGNLRRSRKDNRYSTLFPGQLISYWADSPKTARAEAKKWGAGNNLITFWAYDDGSSFFPTVYPAEPIRIIDGREIKFNRILQKLNKNEKLSENDWLVLDKIAYEKPDCLAYESEALRGGLNYLFFENGFKKLSLREVKLRLGDKLGKNQSKVTCALTSDYTPNLKGYCALFMPIAKIKYDDNTANSDFIRLKLDVINNKAQRIRENDKT